MKILFFICAALCVAAVWKDYGTSAAFACISTFASGFAVGASPVQGEIALRKWLDKHDEGAS